MMGEEDDCIAEYSALFLFINGLPNTQNLIAGDISHEWVDSVKKIVKKIFFLLVRTQAFVFP